MKPALLLLAALLAATGSASAQGGGTFCEGDGWQALTDPLGPVLEEVVNATTTYLPNTFAMAASNYTRCAGEALQVAASGCQRPRPGPIDGTQLWLVATLTCAGDTVEGLPPAAQELRVNVTADGELAGAQTLRISLSPDGVLSEDVPPENWL